MIYNTLLTTWGKSEIFTGCGDNVDGALRFGPNVKGAQVWANQ